MVKRPGIDSFSRLQHCWVDFPTTPVNSVEAEEIAGAFTTGCIPGACHFLISAARFLHVRGRGGNMRNKPLVLILLLFFATIVTVGCERLTRPNVSGVWKGSIQASEKNG